MGGKESNVESAAFHKLSATDQAHVTRLVSSLCRSYREWLRQRETLPHHPTNAARGFVQQRYHKQALTKAYNKFHKENPSSSVTRAALDQGFVAKAFEQQKTERRRRKREETRKGKEAVKEKTPEESEEEEEEEVEFESTPEEERKDKGNDDNDGAAGGAGIAA